jgi:hypothetical protein
MIAQGSPSGMMVAAGGYFNDASEVELVGLEPTTFWLPARRSPS